VLTRPLAADEYVPPPQGEREAVAAVAKHGGRIQVDGEYRATTITLGQNATDDDVKLLPACERLVTLQISSPKVTDAGLESLKKLTKLTSMTIANAGLTDEGLAGLRTALPNCRISALRGGPGGPGFAGPGFAGPGFAGPNAVGPFGAPDRSPWNSSTSTPSRTTLARNSSVQDDLQLTPEQRKQIADAVEAASAAAVSRAMETKIMAALSKDQLARLRQIELQQLGILGLLQEDAATQLKLTDDQKGMLAKLQSDATTALRVATSELRQRRGGPASELSAKLREKTAEINKERDENMLAVLSAEQRNSWLTMLGPKGPEVSSASERFNPFSGRTAADMAKTVFERYDTDKNGTLTDAEFPETVRLRQTLKATGAAMTFPMAREDFEKAYTKYMDGVGLRR
jgi:hypothetical protein